MERIPELIQFVKQNPKLLLCVLFVAGLVVVTIAGRLHRWDRERVKRNEEILNRRIRRDLDAEGK